MEQERISDDTIRVFMNKDELKDRGLELTDLITDHARVEEFFHDVLEEVDADHSFAEDSMITFQVAPTGQGLEIFISRTAMNDDDDALEYGDDDEQKQVDQYSKLARDAVKKFMGHEHAKKKEPAPQEEDYEFFDDGASVSVTLQLPDFEAMVSLARELRLEGGVSDLYKYQNQYYLTLRFYDNMISESEAQIQISVASEYGERSKLTAEYLDEHAAHIMETSALETTRYYFK